VDRAGKRSSRSIDERDWNVAERLVDEAFLKELKDVSNDAINKADLLKFKAEIAMEQGQWKNALAHQQAAGGCKTN